MGCVRGSATTATTPLSKHRMIIVAVPKVTRKIQIAGVFGAGVKEIVPAYAWPRSAWECRSLH